MKTPDVIKKGLERCKDDRCICDECEFSDGNVKKWRSLMGDALDYIEQLENHISLNTLRDSIFEDAVAHGLWEGTDCIVKECIDAAIQEGEPADQEEMMRGLAMEFIRREVNELDEASVNAEAYTDELADVIIASLSVAGKLGIDIDEAVRRKMEINKGRPWKHGKDEKK